MPNNTAKLVMILRTGEFEFKNYLIIIFLNSEPSQICIDLTTTRVVLLVFCVRYTILSKKIAQNFNTGGNF